MKISGLREDILFESKEYPLMLPKKDCQGGFRISPGTPLKRPKGALAPLGNLPEVTGDFGETGAGTSLHAYGGRWDGNPGRDACGHSGHCAL